MDQTNRKADQDHQTALTQTLGQIQRLPAREVMTRTLQLAWRFWRVSLNKLFQRQLWANGVLRLLSSQSDAKECDHYQFQE